MPERIMNLPNSSTLLSGSIPKPKWRGSKAKQAASAVGLAQSQYYPVLALQSCGQVCPASRCLFH